MENTVEDLTAEQLQDKLSLSFEQIAYLESQNCFLRLKLKLIIQHCLQNNITDTQEISRRSQVDKGIATVSFDYLEQGIQTDIVPDHQINQIQSQSREYDSPEATRKVEDDYDIKDDNGDLLKTPVVMELSNTLLNLKWGFKKRESKLKKELKNYKSALHLLYYNHEDLRGKFKAICNSLCDQLDLAENVQQLREQQKLVVKSNEANSADLLVQFRAQDAILKTQLDQISSGVQNVAEEAQSQLEACRVKIIDARQERNKFILAAKELEAELEEQELAALADSANIVDKSTKTLIDGIVDKVGTSNSLMPVKQSDERNSTDEGINMVDKENGSPDVKSAKMDAIRTITDTKKQSSTNELKEKKLSKSAKEKPSSKKSKNSNAKGIEKSSSKSKSKSKRPRKHKSSSSSSDSLDSDQESDQEFNASDSDSTSSSSSQSSEQSSASSSSSSPKKLQRHKKKKSIKKYEEMKLVPKSVTNAGSMGSSFSATNGQIQALYQQRILDEELLNSIADTQSSLGEMLLKAASISSLQLFSRNDDSLETQLKIAEDKIVTLLAEKKQLEENERKLRISFEGQNQAKWRMIQELEAKNSELQYILENQVTQNSNEQRKSQKDETSPVSNDDSSDGQQTIDESSIISEKDALSKLLFSPKDQPAVQPMKKQSFGQQASFLQQNSSSMLKTQANHSEPTTENISNRNSNGTSNSSSFLSLTSSSEDMRQQNNNKTSRQGSGILKSTNYRTDSQRSLKVTGFNSAMENNEDLLAMDQIDNFHDQRQNTGNSGNEGLEEEKASGYPSQSSIQSSQNRNNSMRQSHSLPTASSGHSVRPTVSFRDQVADDADLVVKASKAGARLSDLGEYEFEDGEAEEEEDVHSIGTLENFQDEMQSSLIRGQSSRSNIPRENSESIGNISTDYSKNHIRDRLVPSTQTGSHDNIHDENNQQDEELKQGEGHHINDDDARMSVEELLLGGKKQSNAQNQRPPRYPSQSSQQLHQNSRNNKSQQNDTSVVLFDDGTSIDLVDAVEELRRMLQEVEAAKETMRIKNVELEHERDVLQMENASVQQDNRALKKENEELAKENMRLKREVDLYRTKIFTVVNKEGSSLIHGLPDINISFQSRSASASASAIAAEYDYLSPSTSTSQALYIINQLVHNNNDLVERNAFLEREKKRLDTALTEKETHLRQRLQELQEKETSNLKMKNLLTQANSTITATVEDYHILQEQVQILTSKLKEISVENTHLKALLSPTKRTKAIGAANASYLSDQRQQQQQLVLHDQMQNPKQRSVLSSSMLAASPQISQPSATAPTNQSQSPSHSSYIPLGSSSTFDATPQSLYNVPSVAADQQKNASNNIPTNSMRRELSTADLVARLQSSYQLPPSSTQPASQRQQQLQQPPQPPQPPQPSQQYMYQQYSQQQYTQPLPKQDSPAATSSVNTSFSPFSPTPQQNHYYQAAANSYNHQEPIYHNKAAVHTDETARISNDAYGNFSTSVASPPPSIASSSTRRYLDERYPSATSSPSSTMRSAQPQKYEVSRQDIEARLLEYARRHPSAR